MKLGRTRKRINLALQGGGAHGAFTWGVLDRLLEDDGIDLGWISATSAGAVNAAALVAGLARGGREGARATLRDVWDAVEKAGVPDLLRLMPFFMGLARGSSLPDLSGLVSPYHFNPLNFDPLRRALSAHMDFEKIRAFAGFELLIAATDVSTGRPRLFRRAELTLEMVLASACLPSLHHAVEIDGRAYWDGGFSANPDIVTLASESPVGDTLIVQLNPLARITIPRTAREIAAQVNAITLNQPLLRDVELIVAAREAPAGWFGGANGRLGRLRRHRFHLIEAGSYTANLSADSRIAPDRGLLDYLRDSGRTEAGEWLNMSRRQIGRRATVDLQEHFLPSAPGNRELLDASDGTSRDAA